MFHEPSKDFLYSSYLVETEHRDTVETIKSGRATAFLLEVADGSPWLVTNRHVIDLNFRQTTSKYQDFELTGLHVTGRRTDDSTYTFQFHPSARIFFHLNPENDVALIEGRVLLDGPDSWHWHFGIEHLATPEVFETIEPFDLVCYTGFPDQYDKLGSRPILRSGHIASDPRYNYSWDKTDHGQCVAYEGFSSPGSSGGPVFAPPRGMRGIPRSRHGFLVGVNAAHLKDGAVGHSGISCFYKSTVMLEIIQQHDLNSFMLSDNGG